MAVDYGILERTPSIASRFMAGQQEAAAEQDRNMLRQMQMEQMGAQRENILAQREQRLAQADERRAAEMRRQQRQTFLEGLGAKMAEGGYKLDRPTLGQVLQFGMQTGEDSLIKLATEGMKALDEEERDKTEMARLGLGPAPAAPPPANAFAVPSLAEGAAAPAPVNAMVDRGRVQQMIMSPSPRVRQMGQALAGTLEKEPRDRLLTPEEEAQRIRIARESRPPAQPAQPREPSAPVAVVNEATGGITYVTREEALGRTPASAIEGLAPKEIQRREADFPRAKQAVATVGGTMSTIEQTIDRLLNNKSGLDSITGLVYGRTPGVTDAARLAEADLNQLKNLAFVQGLTELRAASQTGAGVGNVSNREGDRFENLKASLERTQSYGDMVAALKRLKAQAQATRSGLATAFEDTYSYRESRKPAGGEKPTSSKPSGGATGGWSVVR